MNINLKIMHDNKILVQRLNPEKVPIKNERIEIINDKGNVERYFVWEAKQSFLYYSNSEDDIREITLYLVND